MEATMFTPDLLVGIVGTIISLIFSYVPSLNTWFAGKTDDFKKLSMLAMMVITTVVAFILACTDFITIANFVCAKGTALDFVRVLITAVIANQGVYMISPTLNKVKQAKDERLGVPMGADKYAQPE